jgi:hypothetical protein
VCGSGEGSVPIWSVGTVDLLPTNETVEDRFLHRTSTTDWPINQLARSASIHTAVARPSSETDDVSFLGTRLRGVDVAATGELTRKSSWQNVHLYKVYVRFSKPHPNTSCFSSSAMLNSRAPSNSKGVIDNEL